MRIVLLALLTLLTVSALAQTNPFLDPGFWKKNPAVEDVKKAIGEGHDPLAFNSNAFDGITLAINNNAPYETIVFLLNHPGASVHRITHDGRIYLHWAANRGQVKLVKYLIEKGSNLDAEDSRGTLPVAFAANGGQSNPAVYDAFFEAGVKPQKKYRNGMTLLMIGIANDPTLTLTSFFESKGMSLQDVDDQGNTVFDHAARAGDVKLLKSLLARGAKPSDNAILMAAQGSRRGPAPMEVFQFLLNDLQLNAKAVAASGDNVLHYLVRRPNQSELVRFFLEKGVDPNQVNQEGNNVLMNAVGGNDTAMAGLILNRTTQIDAANKKGETALFMATRNSSPAMMGLLIQKGADVKRIDVDGNNIAAHLIQSYRAPRAGETADVFGEKIKLLQENGLNFKQAQQNGNTLYHFAVAENDINLLKRIATLGIDVNARNKDGLTALHRAAMISKNDAVLKFLLSVGADKSIKTEFDETAYDLALENDYLKNNQISIDFLH